MKRLGLLVALAERQRPGRGQQQARPAVDLVGRQARQPLEHGALAAARHQRFVQAALGQVVGGLALAGGQRMPRRRFEQARARPATRRRARAARPARRPAAARSAAAARRAPARACAATRSPRRRRRPACRAPAAPGARRRRRRRRRAAQVGVQGSRIAMRVRKATSAGSRLASSRSTNWSRSAPPCAAIAETSALRVAAARPSPTARAAGRAASPRSARAGAPRRRGRRGCRSARAPARSSRRAGSAAAPGRPRRSCRRRPGRRCSSWQSARAATTTRRLGGALRSR